MTTYVDSSVLVALYVPERFSKRARTVMASLVSAPYTALHELELPNAFALMAGRAAISTGERATIRLQLQEDVDSGRLASVAPDWADVFTVASAMSDSYTENVLARSLDVLHVATARVLGCRRFVSADDRQLGLAKPAGFTVTDIKGGSRTPARRPGVK